MTSGRSQSLKNLPRTPPEAIRVLYEISGIGLYLEANFGVATLANALILVKCS
jgi:hypothetical protein